MMKIPKENYFRRWGFWHICKIRFTGAQTRKRSKQLYNRSNQNWLIDCLTLLNSSTEMSGSLYIMQAWFQRGRGWARLSDWHCAPLWCDFYWIRIGIDRVKNQDIVLGFELSNSSRLLGPKKQYNRLLIRLPGAQPPPYYSCVRVRAVDGEGPWNGFGSVRFFGTDLETVQYIFWLVSSNLELVFLEPASIF